MNYLIQTNLENFKSGTDKEYTHIIISKEEFEVLAGFEAANQNFIRIMKERSNAERGLSPKKQHTGYIVLSTTEKFYKFENYWETIIQTPFGLNMPAHIADNLSEELFAPYTIEPEVEEYKSLISKIGINGEKIIEEFKHLTGKEKTSNTVFFKSMKGNFKSGFWEILIKHTRELSEVPWEMR